MIFTFIFSPYFNILKLRYGSKYVYKQKLPGVVFFSPQKSFWCGFIFIGVLELKCLWDFISKDHNKNLYKKMLGIEMEMASSLIE